MGAGEVIEDQQHDNNQRWKIFFDLHGAGLPELLWGEQPPYHLRRTKPTKFERFRGLRLSRPNSPRGSLDIAAGDLDTLCIDPVVVGKEQ
jgi:hypothetical protein